MAHYDQQDVSVVCPPRAVPACVEANPSGPCILAPPPVGYYPTRDTSSSGYPQNVHTQSKGDNFWKGCSAALCCCCLFDFCCC